MIQPLKTSLALAILATGFNASSNPISQYLEQTKQIKKQFSTQLAPKEYVTKINVSSVTELEKALKYANQVGGNVAIYLATGTYKIAKTLDISANNIWLLSKSQNPYDTILAGIGMHSTSRVDNIIRVTGSYFILDGITLTNAPNHLIQIAGESKANYPIIRNSILQNSYEQLLKVSYNRSNTSSFSRGGIVENCIFQYTQGIAPNYYTGGIDALGATHWLVQNNIFKDIASPDRHIAQHAVHFWANSAHNKIKNNIFIDNDRSIGFGMFNKIKNDGVTYSNMAGSISNNLIYHSNNGDKYADTGIIAELSPKSVIENNIIYQEHSYKNTIEYRFTVTRNVKIENNQTNKQISARDGAKATLKNNSIINQEQFLTHLKAKLETLGITQK